MNILAFDSHTTWQQVFSDWRAREVAWGWEDVWQPRGFASWDEWRRTYTEPLGFESRSWQIFRVDDPVAVVPDMWAVAYSGWKRYYPPGASRARLQDIAAHPDLPQNEKIIGLQNFFPNPTTLIAIRSGDDFALFEGMHRASTIALVAREGRRVAGELFVTLTTFGPDEKMLFEKAITQKE